MHLITKPFTQHPNAVGETYWQHMAMAFSFGTKMMICGLACLAHGIFPFLCIATGSQTVSKLHKEMVTHRGRRSDDQSENKPAPQITAPN